MKTVVLIMKRTSLAQGLIEKTAGDRELFLFLEPDYAGADATIRAYQAQAALLEVTEGDACDVDYCLILCRRLRKVTPKCRLLLMCPEGNRNAVEKAIAAKKKREIDDFVFYDAPMGYLITSLRAL